MDSNTKKESTIPHKEQHYYISLSPGISSFFIMFVLPQLGNLSLLSLFHAWEWEDNFVNKSVCFAFFLCYIMWLLITRVTFIYFLVTFEKDRVIFSGPTRRDILKINDVHFYMAVEKQVPPYYINKKIVIYGATLQNGEIMLLNGLSTNSEKNYQLTNRIRQIVDAPIEIKRKKRYWEPYR